MSHTLELLSIVEHGTVDGYRAGCHGSTVSCGALVSCADVYVRYQGDWGFRKRVDAGETPADIVAEELAQADAVRARDKAANRRAKADGARHAEAREQKRRAASTTGPVNSDSLVTKLADDVRRMAAEKKPIKEIADILGVSPSTVVRARKAVGLRTNRMQVDRAEITRLHGQGWNDTRIAAHLGVANSTISAIRRDELHLPRVSPKDSRGQEESPRAARQRRLVELHGQGMTDGEIAAELGMTRTAVYQARGRLGLTLNRQTTRGPYKKRTTARTSPPALDPSAVVVHGTPEGYTAGCRGRRCPTSPTCTDAMLTAHRAARHHAGGGA